MSEIFPYNNKIQYINHEDFKSQASKERLNIYKRNYELLNDTTSVVDVNDIKYLPSGRFSVYINNHEFECLFSQKKSDKLFIQLNGSRQKGEKLPIFKRWSYESIMDGSILNISDPMYREYDSLELGWYYGTKEESYCIYLTDIIMSVAKYLNIENKNIYFYSSSGGGYASLYCCCMIPESTCIVINPQMDLNLYYYCTEFSRITGVNLKEKDVFRRNELFDLMLESDDSRFIIISNLRAYEDMTQLNALCSHIGCSFTNSLQRLRSNIISWVYDAECHPFHSAQDYPEMFFAIRYLAEIFDNIEPYENLYRYFAELIHERYNLAEILNECNKLKNSQVSEIFCSDNISEISEAKYVYCKQNIFVNSDRNFFNLRLFEKFEDNTIYNITVPFVYSPDKTCDRYCLIIMDEKNNNIMLKKVFDVNSSVSLFIKTNESADRYCLKLYPQIPEKNNNTNLLIENISIRKIDNPFNIVSNTINCNNQQVSRKENTILECFSENDYLYIRGFVILLNTGADIHINSNWKSMEMGFRKEYIVYYDGKNEVYKAEDHINNTWIFILGSVMNTETGVSDISTIGEELICCLNESVDAFYDYVDVLNGRHIIIYSKDGEADLITDATAMRSTYYCETSFCIASHYNLINDIYHCEQHPFFNDYVQYFRKNISCVSLPGNLTPYLNIKMLIPNHKLSLNDGHSIKRFFPRKEIEKIGMDEIFDYIADNICRQYTNLVKNHDVLHSLTAGCDSRISLAAAKNVKDKITLFTYHNSNPDMNNVEHFDRELNYRLAKSIAEQENLKHIEVFFQGPYPSDLVAIMNKNHYHPHNKLIMEMNKRYNFTPDTIHLRSSIIEMLRNTTHILWTVSSRKSLAERFCDWAQYSGEIKEKALPYFEDFVRECEVEEYLKYNYDQPDLIHYWENRLPTWLNASVVVDNDILCDTYMLFNTRKIIAYSFALPTYWRNKNILFKEIITRLWPSLLNYNMPNASKSTYDLVDSEFTGCLPMKKISIKSGNLYNTAKKINVYEQIRDYGLCVGFASYDVEKDDYISVETFYQVNKGISYYYEFDLFTVWQDYAEYGEIKYQIIIDNKVLYSAYCNDFNNRVNQILICFKAAETAKQKIELRLSAVKNSKNNRYNGVIDIKSIILKQEYLKTFDETPKIICSRDMYLTL